MQMNYSLCSNSFFNLCHKLNDSAEHGIGCLKIIFKNQISKYVKNHVNKNVDEFQLLLIAMSHTNMHLNDDCEMNIVIQKVDVF